MCVFGDRPSLAIASEASAQEAVSNAAKHAEARQIIIRLRDEAASLKLQVIDNGSGIRKPGPGGQGLGLRSMSFRAGLIGGELIVEDGPDGGTVITCQISKERLSI